MKRNALLCLLLVASLFFTAASCSAEEVYQISSGELNRLDRNLTELRNINDRQRTESVTLKQQLAESQAQLSQAEKQSQTLKEQLGALKLTMDGQAQSLQNANKLLQQYEQEAKLRLRHSRRQRNIAYVIALTAICFAVRKM